MLTELNKCDIKNISGGASQECINAYFAVQDNRSVVGDLFALILLTPLGLIGKVWGEQSAIQSICGSQRAYEEAHAIYCHSHPKYCKP